MTTPTNQETGPQRAGAPPPSQQRSWWPVHQFIEAVVQQTNYGPVPIAGTPSWCALSDGDPRKLLALAIDGEHHVLRIETGQIALAEASKAIAGSTDWPTVARKIQGRNGVYIRRSA